MTISFDLFVSDYFHLIFIDNNMLLSDKLGGHLDLHELKLELQNHFTDGLVIIIGSGLSCAEGISGMSALADYLQNTIDDILSDDDKAFWSQLSPLIRENGLEEALLSKPLSPNLEEAIVAKTAELILADESKVIAEVFSRARILSFTRLLKHLIKPSDGLPIVTTNYDRLIEIAVEEAGWGVDTLFVGNFAGSLNERESKLSFCRDVLSSQGRKGVKYVFRERASIFKPHGSLDWYDRGGKPVRYSGDLDLPRLIITPGLNKFRNGYESPFDKHRERANSAIDDAKSFLIIGYGFNDAHLETHLIPQIRRGIPTLLLTHTLSQKALTLAREQENVIAIQYTKIKSKTGSLIFFRKEEIFIPDLALWDLNIFIKEVFEPC
ncbi:SIR2 family protein [Xenorhabdus koppenhoeferi]|uniref:SIR2-like domain-containing protein n=1 Tax=Xenorhabdus koppenhoeferi TaxID=351659 RepID=A0A1I7K6T4_9GAMM|nr:SIR2 family protein [Xenorhabdus koppenhoeferi]SFU93108.1 SIR2-like domain-containing protein [Xenorhabdus koppenhoeferi]